MGAFLANNKDIIISDFNVNCPERITISYLANGQVKISIYEKEGSEEQISKILYQPAFAPEGD